jgi:transposase-like protein
MCPGLHGVGLLDFWSRHPPKEQSPVKSTTRRYTPEEKASAVRMVRTLRQELGAEHGTRVAGPR